MSLTKYPYETITRERFLEKTFELDYSNMRRMSKTLPSALFNPQVYKYLCYTHTKKMTKAGYDFSKLKVYVVDELIRPNGHYYRTVYFVEDTSGDSNE
jgi:hypothetical protein